MTITSPHPKYGHGYRIRQGGSASYGSFTVTEVQIKREIEYPRSGLDEFIEDVRDAAKDLLNVRVEVENKDRLYEDGTDATLVVSGWRVATVDDIREADDALAQRAAQRAAYEEHQIAELKKTHSHLFKEDV